jgi:acetolactate synthase I/II/III large subunit
MKVSDYIANFIAEQDVRKCFVLTGGCILHIIDSVAKHKAVSYIPMQHEQSAAMAADAYARITGNIGVALATSGPGATNLLTGVCCSYYDSIPVVLITGQVPGSQLKRDSASRQIGFQETDVVSIFEPVTKYTKLIDDASIVRYELEKAFYLAREGRPGPVLLDICDDIQRANIEPDKLPSFVPPVETKQDELLNNYANKMVDMINQSERPVLILGGGIRLAGAVSLARQLVHRFNLPFTLTWGGMDYISHDNPLFVGGFGVTSGRAGNFAVQNSDLVIAIGTRLDSHEVGANINTFARGAKVIVVDIDISEQAKYLKMGKHIDLLVTADAHDVIHRVLEQKNRVIEQDRGEWFSRIARWKSKYPICLDSYRQQAEKVNPYVIMEELSKQINKNAVIVTDCGSNLIWTMQGLMVVDENQRVISAFNHSPMGYAFPASIGAALADPGRQVICITGDGGFQINVQELATIERHNIDIKIFILNNHGHGIIQGTQDNWLESRHHASNPSEGGLPDPDFNKIAVAYGIKTKGIGKHQELKNTIRDVLISEGPVLCNVHLLSGVQIYPKLLVGRPIEDSDPLLPRDEFNENMLV